MSITNYVPVSMYHATTQVFDDAEATANLVRTALETLADNCRYAGKRDVFWEAFSTHGSETTTTYTSSDNTQWVLLDSIVATLPTTIALGDLIDITASVRFYGVVSLVRLTFYGGGGGSTVLTSLGPVAVDNGVVTITGRVTADAAVVAASAAGTLHVHFAVKPLSAAASTMMLPINSKCSVLRDL